MCLFTEVFYCSLSSAMQSQCEIHDIGLKGRQIEFTSPAYCSHSNNPTEFSTLKHTNLRQAWAKHKISDSEGEWKLGAHNALRSKNNNLRCHSSGHFFSIWATNKTYFVFLAILEV